MSNTIIQKTQNDKYALLSNNEIVTFVNSLQVKQCHLKKFIETNFPELLYEIINRTSFLKESEKIQYPITARIYCLQNNILEQPLCEFEECNKVVGWKGSRKSFSHFCCQEHSSKSKLRKERMKQTIRLKYNSDYFFQTDEFKKKTKETCVQKYGCDNPAKCSEIRSKARKTMLDRYGCEYTAQSNVLRKKMEETCLKNNKVRNPLQSNEIRKISEQTQKNKYGGIGFASKELRSKVESTMINLFGVSHPSQSKTIRDKIKATCIKKFNVDNPFKSEKIRDDFLKKNESIYGTQFPSQNQEIKNKMKNTCFSKWGKWYCQTKEFASKSHKPYTNSKYPDMTFGSSWEFTVYDFLNEHNIEFKYQLEPIQYEYDGKKYYYIPDFLINGKIYEVKGEQFFRINESTGKEEMFCPYRYDWWTDEYYQWRCGKEEAKHQCMLNNNVIILRDNDIKNLNNINF